MKLLPPVVSVGQDLKQGDGNVAPGRSVSVTLHSTSLDLEHFDIHGPRRMHPAGFGDPSQGEKNGG